MPPEIQPTATLYRWSDIAPEQLNPLLTRQFIAGDQAMIARIVLSAGCVVPRHEHHNEQISYILSGALEMTAYHPDGSSTAHIVRAGEVLVLPAHVPHSARALEDTVNIDLFAPPRQDWIDKDDSYLR